MNRKRIAIIGGGFSGASLAALLMQASPRPSVTLIERSARLGAGLAYGANDGAHLLNVRASNMSAFATEPDHFARWLKARTGESADAFAPRKLYGAYVAETLRKASGAFGHRLQRVRGEAIACERDGEAWRISLADGRVIAADAVALAIGHRPPRALAPFAQSGVALIDAWDEAAQRLLPRGDVLLLGTGLTMVDVALSLARRRSAGTIFALSRRGLTPRPHLDPPRPRPSERIDLPPPLSTALAVFRAEVARLNAAGEPWQQAMERLRHYTTPLWRRLSPHEQRRFLRHLRPYWDVHRHRMAPSIAARIDALKSAGRLRILAGEITSAEPAGRSVLVEHRQRGSFARHRFEVAGIINCTGGDSDLGRSDDPLLNQMLRAGLIRPHTSGVGLDLDSESRVIGADGAAHASLFAVGPLTQGAFWESTAVPDIRLWLAEIAAKLC